MKFALLVVALTTAVFAGGTNVAVPEIDAASATAALTLLSGGVLVLRSRRVKG